MSLRLLFVSETSPAVSLADGHHVTLGWILCTDPHFRATWPPNDTEMISHSPLLPLALDLNLDVVEVATPTSSAPSGTSTCLLRTTGPIRKLAYTATLKPLLIWLLVTAKGELR